MINSTNVAVQTVVANANVLFDSTIIRTRSCGCGGWLVHDEGSGLFTITNGGIYEIGYNANITSAETGVVSLVLEMNGEELGGTETIYTVATANAYNNVAASRLVRIPCNASMTISLGNNSALTLLVQDANIIIKRLA